MALFKRSVVGGLDTDSEDRYISQGDWSYALNIRGGVTDVNSRGTIENSKGNVLVSFTMPSGINKVIGKYNDQLDKRVFYFVFNSFDNHGIYLYNAENNTIELVITSDLLRFTYDMVITGINLVNKKLLFWTDDVNEPSYINVDRARSKNVTLTITNGNLYTTSILWAVSGELLTLIGSLTTDTEVRDAFVNAINSSVELADKQVSAMATTSNSVIIFFDDPSVSNSVQNNICIINEALTTTGYPNVLTRQNIDAIPYQPLPPLVCQYGDDSTIVINALKANLFQFRYRYIYADYRKSSWSTISKVPLPFEYAFNSLSPHLNNYIQINIPTGDGTVIKIEIAGRTRNTGDFFLIERIDKKLDLVIPDSIYPFRFLNDGIYNSISVAESNKLFDYVPLKAKAQEIIDDNKIVYGNIVEGYDNISGFRMVSNPVYTEKGISVLPVIQGTVIIGGQNLNTLTFGGLFYGYEKITIDYFGFPPNQVNPISGTLIILPSPSSTINTIALDVAQRLQIAGLNASAGYNSNTLYLGPEVVFTDNTVFTSAVISLNSSISNNFPAYPSFKRGANHPFGVVYEDQAGRLGTVQVSDESTSYVEYFTNPLITEKGAVDMYINVHSLPPKWAVKYHIVYAKNQSIEEGVQGEGFIQFTLENMTALSNTLYQMSINPIIWFNDNNANSTLSYGYAKGDRIRFIKDNTGNCVSVNYDYEIISFDEGTGFLTFDVGTVLAFPGADFFSGLYEIYTPKKTIQNKVYYEIGECYDIIDAGLSTRRHQGGQSDQIINGTLLGSPINLPAVTLLTKGDVYFRNRNMPLNAVATSTSIQAIEDFNFSDFYISNVTDIGRPNIIDVDARQVRRATTTYFSESFIPNTNINGLGTIYPLNFKDYDLNYGSIQKFYSEDKRLLAFQELKCGFILVNSSVIYDQSGISSIQKSDKILSDMVYYSGEYGISKHPESFAVYGISKYFVDDNRSVVLRLSQDGLTPISEYKTHTYFTNKFRNLLKSGHDYKIFGEYDLTFNEYVLSFADVTELEYTYFEGKGGVGSITSADVVLLMAGETITFSEPKNRWVSWWSYVAESMARIGLNFVTFNNGNLYLHNVNPTFDNFYGNQYTSKIDLMFNDEPSVMKFYKSMEIESNIPWNVNFSNQKGQSSSLITTDFEDIEGVYWAFLLRDSNTPNITDGLINGDDLRSVELKLKLESDSTTFIKLFAVGLKAEKSELTNA